MLSASRPKRAPTGARQGAQMRGSTARHNIAGTLAVAMILAVPGQARANVDPTMVIHVANLADVERDVLETAMDRMANVYTLIGVRIVWDDRGPAVNRAQQRELHLNVLLVTRDKRQKTIAADGVKGNLLGYAHPSSGRAYIFPDRIRSLRRGATSFATQLGDVIAHEVGHLVLREQRHSHSGIMRASFMPTLSVQTFTGTEASTIHALLASCSVGSDLSCTSPPTESTASRR